MVEVCRQGGSVEFAAGAVTVGSYRLDDPFKPYLHPLRTLGGRVATLAVPTDHRHHKGVMYALTTTDVNWWEETSTAAFDYAEHVGVQRSLTLELHEDGITQTLLWSAEDGSRETFHEVRTVTCSVSGSVVTWNWASRFLVVRDVTLRQSPASEPGFHGRLVNYHGLGIRFPRTFGWDRATGRWSGDGVEYEPEGLRGRVVKTATVEDVVDGEFPVPRVRLSLTQLGTEHAVFAMATPFAFLSAGPSAAAPVELAAGSEFREHYRIEVRDANG